MNTKKSKSPHYAAVVIPLVGAFVLLAGCASEPTSRVVSAPPPGAPTVAPAPTTIIVPANQTQQVVVPATTMTSPSTIIVQQAPPALQQESMVERPSSRHVWVAGYWAWKADHYTWLPGHWIIPPRDGAVWIPPRWERDGTAYRFYDGYWD